MNNITISGRVTRDPKAGESSGRVWWLVPLAVNRKGKDAGTDYFDCFFGSRFENMIPYIKKGTPLVVSGAMLSKDREVDGAKIRSWSLSVEQADFCGGSKKESE